MKFLFAETSIGIICKCGTYGDVSTYVEPISPKDPAIEHHVCANCGRECEVTIKITCKAEEIDEGDVGYKGYSI